ncbi:GLPGLI family protein [Kaistella flava (ex Peng et al. 2021)]|uniref:GLPGLI family protein n=1 Tax=Kaistella flava (ex Peng et al. 2021) TaxID=2038776 RepID=A0A7M2Y936_9FLAO|nr:GLPGLI family protein [Kaistella flava (ex Peng et al. 2021)]QOW09853.1 GLPGLI family protein [Kaistella flava (ex Peng et al. 2021)]
MKTILFFFQKTVCLILFIFSLTIFAQNSSISYEFIYKTNPTQKDRIKKQNYKLDILGGKSIFRTESRRSSDSLIAKTGFGLGYNTDPNHELYLTKDRDHSIIRKHFVSPLSRDKFFIKIDDQLKWKILPETTVIANFNCQKAEVEYGGRNWFAWFTKEIPVSEGPYCFHGLPGLILQIQDDQEDYLFKATEIKNLANSSLFEIDGGKQITWNQFNKILQDYFDSPYNFAKAKGMKVVKDNGSGGTMEIDYRKRVKETQEMLLENNNPIELNYKIKYR